MSPEELRKRQVSGRPPYNRRPLSIDGVSPGSVRRPAPPPRPEQRPMLPPRPQPPSSPTILPPPQPAQTAPPAPWQPPTQPTLAAPQPVTPPVPPATPVPPTAAATPSSDFKPPSTKKSRRRLIIKIMLVLLAVAALVAAVLYWFQWQERKNDPDLAFRDALQTSLSTTKLRSEISGDSSSQLSYDFTKQTEPLVSNEARVKIAESAFAISGYGSVKNTYISYKELPATLDPKLTATVKDAWVGLRVDGRAPIGVSTVLANLADPRYQVVGPVIFGNFPLQTRDQLISFMDANHVYKYDKTKVIKKTINDTDVFVYPVKLNLSYLKIANQSAAASMKFTPADVQAAINDLDHIKDATLTLYITAAEHRLQQVELVSTVNGPMTYTFSRYNQENLPGEPQTKLTWKDFKPVYDQITAQVASQQAKDLTKKRN